MKALVALVGCMLATTTAVAQDKAFTDRVVDVVAGEMRAAIVADIKSFCADGWANDFVMQEHCIGEQKTGYAEAQAYEVMASTDAAIIWANCATDWQDEQERQDWVMMAHCIEEQDAARRRLQSQ